MWNESSDSRVSVVGASSAHPDEAPGWSGVGHPSPCVGSRSIGLVRCWATTALAAMAATCSILKVILAQAPSVPTSWDRLANRGRLRARPPLRSGTRTLTPCATDVGGHGGRLGIEQALLQWRLLRGSQWSRGATWLPLRCCGGGAEAGRRCRGSMVGCGGCLVAQRGGTA